MTRTSGKASSTSPPLDISLSRFIQHNFRIVLTGAAESWETTAATRPESTWNVQIRKNEIRGWLLLWIEQKYPPLGEQEWITTLSCMHGEIVWVKVGKMDALTTVASMLGQHKKGRGEHFHAFCSSNETNESCDRFLLETQRRAEGARCLSQKKILLH